MKCDYKFREYNVIAQSLTRFILHLLTVPLRHSGLDKLSFQSKFRKNSQLYFTNHSRVFSLFLRLFFFLFQIVEFDANSKMIDCPSSSRMLVCKFCNKSKHVLNLVRYFLQNFFSLLKFSI